MLSTIVATTRFLRALITAAWDPASRGIVILAVATLLTGTFFYRWAEGWGFVDALYFSVVTLTTIGYGDLLPTTTGAKLFTIIYSLIGIGIIAAFVTSLAMTVRDNHDASQRRGAGDADTAE